MNVRNAGIEKAIETLDESVDFQLQLIGSYDRAVDGCIESRGIAACREDSNAFLLGTVRGKT